ncbi:MAG: phosphate ABC transporter ATP-binding protein PstB [Candidatus ainarchaeum sp.]|nr:phosphate ABC transporter ATP-binding protein PstB [Candidatus ainarchaeum sp.]
MRCRGFSLWYGKVQALKGVHFGVRKNKVTALIGPSGCGKSTLIRALNRMNDVIDCVRTEGEIEFLGRNVYGPGVDVTELRTKVGMIFQRPNPFPMSIYENVVYGLRVHGVNDRRVLDEAVERSLKQAALWDEVDCRLHEPALSLSGGQQQRLCVARALAGGPEVLLMDEPTSALDPIATAKIEDLVYHLKRDYTVVIVTHNMQQAARVSDFTGFLYLGELVEFGETEQVFKRPKEALTERYITGSFG